MTTISPLGRAEVVFPARRPHPDRGPTEPVTAPASGSTEVGETPITYAAQPSRADVDLRMLRYFVVLAEHGHFGRAAAALHLSQPALSRQIQRLEDQLDLRLFDRTPQGARLTHPGTIFIRHARSLLRSAAHAVAAARAAIGPSHMTIGYSGNLIITAVVREVRHRHPDAEVRSRYLGWDDQQSALLDHRVDAVLAHMPFPTGGLDVTVVHEEPRVLITSVSHPMAERPSVSLADIADEPLVHLPDPMFNAFWCVEPRPDGWPAPTGPVVAALEDRLEFVAGDEAVAIVPASLERTTCRRDVAFVPLTGIGPCQVVLATRADEHNELLRTVRAAARHHLAAAGHREHEVRHVSGCP